MPAKNKLSRRRFLTTSAAALSAPYFVPGRVLGKDGAVAPSERITLGMVGTGGMGQFSARAFARYKDAQIVAVCDVDENNRNACAQSVNEAYENQDCAKYRDFREVISREDIDAVNIATPDHWHALVCVAAAEAGKDIYCQKPLTHTFAEGQAIVAAVKKHNVIFQVGSQQRSRSDFRHAVELIMNGHIGRVKHIEVGLPTGHTDPEKTTSPELCKEIDPPDSLDYDFWCGPSKKLPYIPARLHFHWRWNMAYGAGQLMDWIGHHNDIAHWAIGEDLGGPVEVQAFNFTYPEDKSIYDAAVNYEVWSKYASGITISCANKYPNGTKFIGDEGWLFCSRSKLAGSHPSILSRDFNPGPKSAYHSPEHHRNFLDGVKSRKPCICPAEVGHRSITPGYLGLASDALGGREIHWDPRTETVINDPEAELLLKSVDYRSPWSLTPRKTTRVARV